jgi:DNA-binding transcriptional ArsR family regulator
LVRYIHLNPLRAKLVKDIGGLEVYPYAEEMKRRYRLKVEGYDLQKLAGKVARDLGLEAEDLLRPGKYGGVVEGRDLVCYWAVREFGWSVTDIARRIGISQPAVSYAVRRGERAVRKRGLWISLK